MTPRHALAPSPCPPRRTAAFTLVELLVVLAILSALASVVLPTIGRARVQALNAQCASNVRQICQAIFAYAADHRGRNPQNLYWVPGQFWYDDERVGQYLAPAGARKDGVLSCPADPGALRSYSMNAWTSSNLDNWAFAPPARGQLWGPAPANSSSVMLVVESWSGGGTAKAGWTAAAVVGLVGDTPGQRFGAAGGLIPYDTGRLGKVNCELAFERHRPPGSPGKLREPIGAVHIGYADGHVELKGSGALADPATGKSTLDTLWSPLDFAQNQ